MIRTCCRWPQDATPSTCRDPKTPTPTAPTNMSAALDLPPAGVGILEGAGGGAVGFSKVAWNLKAYDRQYMQQLQGRLCCLSGVAGSLHQRSCDGQTAS